MASKKRKILVTNALPYANGMLHLGHLVGTIQGDIWVRWQKMQGHDCLYICGSDSHGTPIMIQAEKMKISPEELIKTIQKEQERDFGDFLIEFDNYHTTHSSENLELVENIFERHVAAGNIHTKTIKQFYDPVKEMFLPDRYIKGECPKCQAKDQYGDNCEVCGATYSPPELNNPYSVLTGAKPIEKESEHYFFKLQNKENFLKTWTREGHLPSQVINKLDEWFAAGLKEWDISRDAPYFGFAIPGAKDKFFYVWLDAPIGYMASFKNLCNKKTELNFAEYWESHNTELYHFIGKDIVYFHALFWPALLEGANYRTPTKIFVNGFLTIEGQKMSKSRGTFILARTYLDHFPAEYLRYYFATKLSEKIEDLDFNFDDFMHRINADLVGKFINIASRCASFINKNFNNNLSSDVENINLLQQFSEEGEDIGKHLEKMEFSQAMRMIMSLADRANQYIDEKKPWNLIKIPHEKNNVQIVCTTALNLFKILMIYLKPVLPETAKQVENLLQIPPLTWEDKNKLLINHTIKEFKPWIRRIDENHIKEMKKAMNTNKQDNPPAEEKKVSKSITIDEFSKVDLRVAKILEANAIPEADKLLHLKVDIGTETKEIFAGIKSAYQPEELVGRYVVIVANLEPRKMRFGTSEGMLLAASGQNGEPGLWLLSPDMGATAGMKVK